MPFFVNCTFSVRAGEFAVALKFKVASPEDRQPKFVVLPACLALAREGGWPKRPEVALLSHGTESPRPHSLARSATFASSYVSRVVILIALFARGGFGVRRRRRLVPLHNEAVGAIVCSAPLKLIFGESPVRQFQMCVSGAVVVVAEPRHSLSVSLQVKAK